MKPRARANLVLYALSALLALQSLYFLAKTPLLVLLALAYVIVFGVLFSRVGVRKEFFATTLVVWNVIAALIIVLTTPWGDSGVGQIILAILILVYGLLIGSIAPLAITIALFLFKKRQSLTARVKRLFSR
ncbi:hypothetical protein COT72_01780 [archaeon CG10_big_fil_rev_8_21_14_0_10_43_11]|nr:MAG: hypothetical protein COT72_01780 [archaeon CG10_big_fil_rev_8_21_14_0_10_43_11]